MRGREQEHEIKPIIWVRSSHKDLKIAQNLAKGG